jgi:pyruvate,water dikinase
MTDNSNALRFYQKRGWLTLWGLLVTIGILSTTAASPCSIVAREYSIPAVLATGLATRRIKDGQTITVDGGAGTVELK